VAELVRRDFTVPASSRCFLLMRPAGWDVDDLDDTAGADKPFVRGGADIVFVKTGHLSSTCERAGTPWSARSGRTEFVGAVSAGAVGTAAPCTVRRAQIQGPGHGRDHRPHRVAR